MSIFSKAYDWLGDQFGFQGGSFIRNGSSIGTYSGKKVTPRSSLQTIAVLRCVTLLAGAGASLPIDVFKKAGKLRTPLPNHAVETLLDSTPNPEMSSMDLRAMLWAHFLLWGNAYAKIVWSGGKPVALWPLQPDCMEIKRHEVTGDLVYLYTPPGKSAVPYESKEVLHIRWFSLDGINGLSAIAQARQSIGRNQSAEEYGSRFFANGAKPSLAIEYPAKLGDIAIKNLRDSFQDTYGGVENAHRIAVMEQGAKISPLSINPRDAQFLEQEQYNDEKIAMLFGLPPSMIGLTSKSTSWGTGIAEQKQGMLTFTLSPLLTFFEKAFERCLLRGNEPGVYIKHNLDAFLRSDIKTRFEAYAIGVDKGIINRNTCRSYEDLDPFAGGEIYTVQAQMIPIEMAGKITQPSKQPPEDTPNA